jgi:hypothetical protein
MPPWRSGKPQRFRASPISSLYGEVFGDFKDDTRVNGISVQHEFVVPGE